MKAADWIDRVKTAKGWGSDYRASKELGLSRNAVSNYRAGLRSTLDDDVALRVADALGEPPELVLLDQAIERSKSEAARSALGSVLKRLGGVAATLAVAVGVGSVVSAPSPAQAQQPGKVTSGLYITLSGKKRRRSVFSVMADTLASFSPLPA